MSDKLQPQIIDDKRGILGIFRESIFNQIRFELTIASSEQTFQCELIDIKEQSRRDKDETRTLVFRIFKGSVANGLDAKIEFPRNTELRFGMEGYLIKAKTQLLAYESIKTRDHLHLEVPLTLEAKNLRKNRRKGNESKISTATLLVRSGGNHTEGIFDLFDYSRGGFGGILKVPHGFSLVQDTTLHGQLQAGVSIIPIHCTVKRAHLIEEDIEDWDSYRVGIEQNNLEPEQVTNISFDKRKLKRHNVQEHVTIKSNLNNDISFSLIIEEASVTGFSGRLANVVHNIEFPIGSTFEIQDLNLSITLKGFDGDRFRFYVQGGQLTDRLNWFKRISPYLLEGVSHSVFDAKDLLQVFCASGALSTDYLKTQRTHRHDFLNPIEKTVNDSFWVHRWIHHNKAREVTGHFCALRLGDNGWFIADLAGSPKKESKLPKEFVELFFKSFSDFSCSLSPCPIHMYTWAIDHPYWQFFRENIINSGLVRERVFMGYSRYACANTNSSNDTVVNILPILPTQWERIEEIKQNLKAQKIYLHASLLDFDTQRFSSPMLTQEFRRQGHSFSRKYIEFECNQTRWLAIYSTFPMGGSFNRVPEAVWVFKIEGNDTNAREAWQMLVPKFYQQALLLGLKPSSIRRIFEPSPDNFYFGETTILENILAHPSATKFALRKP